MSLNLVATLLDIGNVWLIIFRAVFTLAAILTFDLSSRSYTHFPFPALAPTPADDDLNGLTLMPQHDY